MYSINRQIAVIKPKQPYVNWINSIVGPKDRCEIGKLQNDCTAYLIPHFDDDSESVEYVKKIYKTIFEIELESWSTDKSNWPKKRSYFLFEKWFYVEFHSEVLDALKNSIEKEEY